VVLVEPPLTEDEQRVLEALSGGGLTVVDLAERTGLPTGLTRVLVALEGRAPPLVERYVDLTEGGDAIWRATTAGLEAVGAL
jgi:DprA winged helix domain